MKINRKWKKKRKEFSDRKNDEMVDIKISILLF